MCENLNNYSSDKTLGYSTQLLRNPKQNVDKSMMQHGCNYVDHGDGTGGFIWNANQETHVMKINKMHVGHITAQHLIHIKKLHLWLRKI